MDGDFDKKAEAYITGTVYNYEEKENSYCLLYTSPSQRDA